MSLEDDDFSTHGFYEKLLSGEVHAVHCKSCESYVMPPTSVCKNCLSKDLEWRKVSDQAHVVTFSEVHVSNKEYQSRTPYVVAIVETVDGLRLPGIILDTTFDKVHIGSSVYIRVSQPTASFPSKYYFILKDRA